MSKEYRQMMQRYAQEAPGNPFSEEEIDRVTAQPQRPDGSSVPLRKWPVVAAMALLLSVGAGMLWPREEGEGVLVAENTHIPPSRDAIHRVSHEEAPETSIPSSRDAIHRVSPEEEEIVANPSQERRDESRLYNEEMLESHPAEHIICYRDGQPVECEEEQTISIIMSFLS